MDLDIHTMKWLGQYFNVSSHDFCIHKILGGTSSNMYFVTVDDKMSAVLRQIVDMHWLQQEPDVICQEAIVLEALQNVKTSIPIPKLMTVDNGSKCPNPSLLMTTLDGAICLQPDQLDVWLFKIANILTKIHQLNPGNIPYSYYRYEDPKHLSIPSWTNYRKEWQTLIDISKESPPDGQEQKLVHRDFQPNNLLWLDGDITGVVDWINACVGPRGVDVGHCRWNIAMIHGVHAANKFLDFYIANNDDFVYDIYWDIVSFLDVVSDPLEVYAGWNMFLDNPISTITMKERMHRYLLHLCEKAKRF